MKTRQIAACPICASDVEPLDVRETYELKALAGSITVDLVMCRACQFVCAGTVLPLDALMRYYEQSPKLREAVPSATDRALYAAQAGFMQRAGRLAGARVLDIGADMGKLLDHLRGEYGCQTFYEEANLTALAWLRESNRHRDAAGLAPDTRFDWIVLSQVLEHIIDPVPMLVGLRRRLEPTGALFVEVPNHGMWDDLDIGLSFEHVNYFSPASLTAALDRAGYHLLSLEVTTDQHYFDGHCRIIRACAQPRASGLIADAARFVREHEQRQKSARVQAVDALSRELEQTGRRGLGLYGAAELAGIVMRHIPASSGRVAAVFDSDSRKHGLDFGGLAVRSPAEIVTVDPGAIVILSSAEADIRQTIATAGYQGMVVGWSELSNV